MGNMCQFGVHPNCCNDCDFCLREERRPYTKKKQLFWLDKIKENIKTIDWKNEYDFGISLLGGELYFITDEEWQESFLDLIDVIIEYVLKVSPNPQCRYSTVTNGMYDPTFLYKVVDKIKDAVGIEKVDINFSYDLKYRFHSEEKRLQCLKNINDFHDRYNYSVGVQMILTQYVINEWKAGRFNVNKFIDEMIPGNMLSFLYPHPIRTGKILPDFNFDRHSLLEFITYLKEESYPTYVSFMLSTYNSCKFKHTGLRNRESHNVDTSVHPELSDGKEQINSNCGHSILYQCYTDTDKCLLCDLMNYDRELFSDYE